MQVRQPGRPDPGDDAGALSRLGLSSSDESLYRLLLASPNGTLAELATATGWELPRVRRHARSLEALGLLTRTQSRPARFTPSAPDAALEVLAFRRHEEIEQARLNAARLAEEFRTAGHGPATAPVTVVRGREAVEHRFLQAQQATRHEVLILDKPPYVVKPYGRQSQVQRTLLGRGVAYRTIYDQTALAAPEQLAEVRDLAAQGERGRVLADLPMKMVITDRRTAMVPSLLPTEQEILVLQSSALLDGLLTLFEMLWQRATPLWPAGAPPADSGDEGSALSAEDEHLLALAASALMFSGTGTDTTADAAKAKAVASAKAQEESFAMQFHATCTDSGVMSQAWPAGPNRFIATATITATCVVPPPAVPTF
ncbi:MAG: hypothetical protein AUG44_27660 [Actinobacteria bacterium 13_1_20CM_3_71_11]|nr:MAG: hypothetical protein AUG44_27660 [Actinobacteria bacterium 13_1_20CM_3_71_11]